MHSRICGLWLPALIAVLAGCFYTVRADKKIVCYYTNWAQYRPRPATFTIDDLDTSMCTHVAFSFAAISNNKLTTIEYNDGDVLNQLLRKKQFNYNLTTILVVGGWGTSAVFSAMAATKSTRQIFIQSAVSLLRKYGLDGLELDWEFPGYYGGSANDKARFTALCQELYQEFVNEGLRTNRNRLLLAAAVAPTKGLVDVGYNVTAVLTYLDWVNVMAYDLHGTWDGKAMTHAPLYGGVSDNITSESAINIWLAAGKADKLVLGVPAYGRSYNLALFTSPGLLAPIVGPAAAGAYTGEAGSLAYYEICYDPSLWSNRARDELGRQVYAWNAQGTWVGFDDPQTVNEKCDYVKANGLAGVALWTIDFDDFNGFFCNSGPYPLLRAINDNFRPGYVKQPSRPNLTPPQTGTTGTARVTAVVGGAATANQGSTPKSFNGKKVVCYYTNWGQYKPDPVKFATKHLDTSLCTHVTFAFAQIINMELATFEFNDYAAYRNISSKKSQDGNLKTLLAIGGWNFGSPGFSATVWNSTTRSKFIKSAISFLRSNDFDGLELDWEFPASRGSPPADRQRFSQLCKELKSAFVIDGKQRNKDPLLLVAAVSAGSNQTAQSYEIAQIASAVDYIVLMAYDLYTSYNTTALHAPLYGQNINDSLNVNYGVDMWLTGGMPASKIVLGVPTYGRTMQLTNRANHGIMAASSGPGFKGLYTDTEGFLAYYEICQDKELWANRIRDPIGKQMYSWNSAGTWVGFDDVQTMYEKCLYMKDNGLAGVAVWSLDLDDFTGSECSGGVYPLLKAMSSCIRLSEPIVARGSTASPTDLPASSSGSPATVLPTMLVPPEESGQYKIICYYTNWAKYRSGAAAYIAQNFSASLCTHVSYSFATIRDRQLALTEVDDPDALVVLQKAKLVNPGLKVLLGVGGNNFDNRLFLDVSEDSDVRKAFAYSVALFLRGNGFDGMDLAWAHPSNVKLNNTVRAAYMDLCADIMQAFNEDSQARQLPRLLLATSVSANYSAYDVPSLGSVVDWVNVMAYDFHASSEPQTGLSSALYSATNALSVDSVIQGWTQAGMPPRKTVLAVPAYGTAWRLSSAMNGLGAPASGPSDKAPYSQQAGIYAYYEICSNPAFRKNVVRDSSLSAIYSWDDKGNWVTYDDPTQLGYKCNYVKENNLAGIAVWAADLDDFGGRFCKAGRYPLLTTVAACFGRITNDTTTESPSGPEIDWTSGVTIPANSAGPNVALQTRTTVLPRATVARSTGGIIASASPAPVLLVPKRTTTPSPSATQATAGRVLIAGNDTDGACTHNQQHMALLICVACLLARQWLF